MLLGRDANGFVEQLATTGADEITIHQFHIVRGGEQFVAGTRAKTIELIAERIGWKDNEFDARYSAH